MRSNGDRLCQGAWHGPCYTESPSDNFPVLSVQDLDDSLVDETHLVEEDKGRFKEGRNGDHLITPFQCDECHFYNMKGRRAIPNLSTDDLLLLCIRRASLDAFWSRERTTVSSNMKEAGKYLENMCLLGIENTAFPPKGPHPKEDAWGMRVACGLLLRSKDKGRNAPHIQFETVRRTRSMFSNVCHTCERGTGLSLVGTEGSMMVSNSATNKPWFKRFMLGCHRRMGDVWLPDQPITMKIMRACLDLLEGYWKAFERDPIGQKKSALSACMLLAGFYGGLRGEEINRVDLGGMKKFWSEGMNGERDRKHVPLVLSGRFKNKVGLKFFTQPLAPVTKAGVDIAKWFSRGIDVLEREGSIKGPLFRNGDKGRRASISEMDSLLCPLLREVQRKFPNLISHETVVEDSFSTYRSLRRGATAEAQNARIPKTVIEANNRWRKYARNNGTAAGMSMMDRYSDASASVPTLIRFSYNLG